MSFLQVRDLVVAYGAIQAVRGVSFDVEKGQIVSLIGSNGAGKTTTLRTISGLLRAVSGQVLLDGEPIQRLPAHEILAKGVAHSPEGRKLFSRMTVEPSMGLSPIMTQKIFSTIKDLQAEGTTILLVEQNALSALALSDRGYVIDLGRTTLSGTGHELLADPRVQEAYLGEGVGS